MRLTAGGASWPATPRAGRSLLGLAGALILVAVLVLVQALRLSPAHRVRAVVGPAAFSVDAAGCPVGAGCLAGDSAPPAMLAAIARAYPASTVDSVSGVYDRRTGKPFRVVVTVQLGAQATLLLTAQRLPGGPANDPDSSDGWFRSHTDLSGNLVVDSRTIRLITGGQPGCSLSLTVTAPGPGGYDDALIRLAHDRDAQLMP